MAAGPKGPCRAVSPEAFWVPAIYLGFVGLEIGFTHFFAKPRQTRGDAAVEIVSTVSLLALVQPAVIVAAIGLTALLFPGRKDALAEIPVIAQVALLLVLDDMMQYWWHRASHSVSWLYNLHRAHHSGEYLSVRTVYRNNLFYYAFMPSLWFTGALVYLGLGPVYVGYVIIKMAVITGAHSDVRWDAPLYRIPALSPLMWVIERTISTPSTHSAHHGQHVSDGITNYKGNFGNLLFFWDILFGTSKITRRYPAAIGIENMAPISAGAQLLWPVIRR
jgi:sterol desaturase/sphingolipid hydroxylase (fatty acid hydroxylase superfamily)